MKDLYNEKIKVLADRNGWSLAHAKGFVDGDIARRRGTAPSKYAQIGIDEYCLGFRAGYYERRIPESMAAKNAGAPAGRPLSNASKGASEI
jgi:hypothetical protein